MRAGRAMSDTSPQCLIEAQPFVTSGDGAGQMTGSMFVHDLNRRRFDGKLGAATIARLEALPDREDARAFLERGAALMQRAGMPAQEFSPFQAELFASVASALLPGCWGGRGPQNTVAGWHTQSD